MDPEVALFLTSLLIILQVIWVDGILSIDNAAALAALAEPLPDDQPAPKPLHWSWLGSQRQCALKLGIWMAFIFRGLLLIGAVWLLNGPVHIVGDIVGAAWLLWLTYRHFFTSDDGDPKPLNTSNFWKFIFWIEVTDLTFSWDNISAVAALSSNVWLLIIGMCISVIFIRFAATSLIPFMEKFPELVHAAYLLIAMIGIELLLGVIVDYKIDPVVQFCLSILIIVGALLYHRFSRRASVTHLS